MFQPLVLGGCKNFPPFGGVWISKGGGVDWLIGSLVDCFSW